MNTAAGLNAVIPAPKTRRFIQRRKVTPVLVRPSVLCITAAANEVNTSTSDNDADRRRPYSLHLQFTILLSFELFCRYYIKQLRDIQQFWHKRYLRGYKRQFRAAPYCIISRYVIFLITEVRYYVRRKSC